MKTVFVYQIAFLLIFTMNATGQPLPDPGSDPLYQGDSVAALPVQTPALDLKEARSDSPSTRHFPNGVAPLSEDSSQMPGSRRQLLFEQKRQLK